MEFNGSSFNDENFQARDDDQKVNRDWQLHKDTMELIKRKMGKADTLIRQYNDKIKECDQLNDELSSAKVEKQDMLNKYNLSMEKLTKFELINLEYKKTIDNYKNTIENQKLKLDENEQHINQLHFKIKDVENQNSLLEDNVKELTHELKSQKLAQKTAEKKEKHNKGIQTISIKMKDSSVNTDSSGSKKMRDSSVNTDSSGSLKMRDSSVNTDSTGSLKMKVLMKDKKIMTDKSIAIVKEPFPVYCSKCESHIKPTPVEQILKIMSSPPPLLLDRLSPMKPKIPASQSFEQVNAPFNSNRNKQTPHFPIMSPEIKRPSLKASPSNDMSSAEINRLTNRLEKLENLVKKTKKKQSKKSCCNQTCSSKNIKFIVQMPSEEKLYEYRKREKRKNQKVKRLNTKNVGIKRKHTSTTGKWQIENQSESEEVEDIPKTKKLKVSKPLKKNKFINKNVDLFKSDEVNVPDIRTNVNMNASHESPSYSLSPSPLPFLQSPTDSLLEEKKTDIDVIKKSFPEIVPEYSERNVDRSKRSLCQILSTDLDEIKNSPGESLPEEMETDVDVDINNKSLFEIQLEDMETPVNVKSCKTLIEETKANVNINIESHIPHINTIDSQVIPEITSQKVGYENNCQSKKKERTVDIESEVRKIIENKNINNLTMRRESLNVKKQLTSKNTDEVEEVSDSENILEILSQSDSEFEEANLPTEEVKEISRNKLQIDSVSEKIEMSIKGSQEAINNLSQELYDVAQRRVKDSDSISLYSGVSSSIAEPISPSTVKEAEEKNEQKENLISENGERKNIPKIDTSDEIILSQDKKTSESETSDDLIEEIPSKDSTRNIQQIGIENRNNTFSDKRLNMLELPTSTNVENKLERKEDVDLLDLLDQESNVKRRHTLPIALGIVHSNKKVGCDDGNNTKQTIPSASDNTTDDNRRDDIFGVQKPVTENKTEDQYVIDISADQAFLNKFYCTLYGNSSAQQNVSEISENKPKEEKSQSADNTEKSVTEHMDVEKNLSLKMLIEEKTTKQDGSNDFSNAKCGNNAERENEELQLHASSDLDSPMSPDTEIPGNETPDADYQLNESSKPESSPGLSKVTRTRSLELESPLSPNILAMDKSEMESPMSPSNEEPVQSDDNAQTDDETMAEESIQMPLRRGRKRLSDSSRANTRVIKQKKLLSKIRNIKKSSKKPMMVSARAPTGVEKAEPSTSRESTKTEAPSTRTPKIVPIKIEESSATQKDTIKANLEITPTIIPTKKQRIAHTPATPRSSDSGKSSELPERKTARKTRSNSTKTPGEENDTLSSIMKDFEKTCKERIEISRTLKAQQIGKAKQLTKFQEHEKVPDIDIKALLGVQSFKPEESPPPAAESSEADKEADSHADTSVKKTRKKRLVNASETATPTRELRSRSKTIDIANPNEAVKPKRAKSESVESPEISEKSKSGSEIETEPIEADDDNSDILSVSSVKCEMPAPVRKKRNSKVQSTADEDDSDAPTVVSISDEHPILKGKKKVCKKKEKLATVFRIDESNCCLPDSVVLSSLNQFLLNPSVSNQFKKKCVNVALARKNEKFIREQLKLLVTGQMWTNDLNFQVIDSFIDFTDLRNIAFGIIEYLASDFAEREKLDATFTPPAPAMTKLEQKILTLVLQIQKKHPEFGDIFENGLRYKIFKLGAPQPVQIVERLFRILAVLCKIKKEREKVRMFLCDAFYCLSMRAVNVFYVALMCWPELLPHHDANNDILAKTIVHIIMTLEANNFPLLFSLRKHLTNYYGYPNSGYMSTNFKAELMKMVEQNVPSSITAMLLLCKRKGPNWSLEHVVKGGLKQMIVYQTHPSPYDALTLLGNILRTFPLKDQDKSVAENVEQLCAVLDSNPRSDDLQEGIVSCLLSISKFSFEQIAQSVIKWQSNKELRPATREKLHTFFKHHDTVWWWKFVQKNFPLSRKD